MKYYIIFLFKGKVVDILCDSENTQDAEYKISALFDSLEENLIINGGGSKLNANGARYDEVQKLTTL